MKTMKKIIVIAGMMGLSVSAVYAQQDSTLNRTVVVENEYNPTVMDASKINVLPKVEEPTVPKMYIDYATSLRPMTAWKNETMSPMVGERKADAAYRGYLRAGYGNNGNVDLKAGYLWDITKKDRLNVGVSLDGWNGDVPFEEQDWSSRFYKTVVDLDYVHRFNRVDMNIGGNYTSQVFNYMRNPAAESVGEKRQHQTMANAYVGVNSKDEDMSIQFMSELGFHYYDQKYFPFSKEIGGEHNLYIKGDVWKPFRTHQRFGVNFMFDNYAYSVEGMDNATSLEFNPYYAYANDVWKVRLGVNVDWWSGTDDKVNFSPDIHMEYVFSDSYVFYAKAGGGRENKSYRDLTALSPYWVLYHFQMPTYMSLDAAIGLKASPAIGWWFNLTGGYQIRENDLKVGLLNDGSLFYASFDQGDSNVFYGSAELKYDYKDLFDLALKATYYSWDWEKISSIDGGPSVYGIFPELELNVEAGAKVMEGLRVYAGYEYQKRVKEEYSEYDPINNLYLGADYRLLKNLNVYGKVRNLLGKEYLGLDAYPTQGLNFLAGLSLQF